MGIPDVTTTTTIKQLPGSHPIPRAALHGIVGHAVFLIVCGILAAVSVPHAVTSPDFWIAATTSLLAALTLLCVRRNQPRIDDREVDMILAVTTLASALWTVRQWTEADNQTATVAAWLFCMATGLLMVSGTRAAMWLWPAAIPALTWALPESARLIALLVVSSFFLTVFAFALLRRGWAPRDQLATIPPKRLALAAGMLVIVALTARIGVPA